MAQDPRALLQKVLGQFPISSLPRKPFLMPALGRESSPKCWWRLQFIWWENRKVRKCSRPIHPSCQCLSSAKARCTFPASLNSLGPPPSFPAHAILLRLSPNPTSLFRQRSRFSLRARCRHPNQEPQRTR